MALAAKPNGSKSPVGARAPGMLSTVKDGLGGATVFFPKFPKEKALREEDVLAAGAGAKAAAEPARMEAMAIFIFVVF